MPFTISHAAVVLPFTRLLARWRVLSAALIGAMVPDFRVFFPWRLARFETHSGSALLTFCLPVGLLTYWVFQLFIKRPVLEVLPDGPYSRWRPFASRASPANWRHWVLAACGILVGAVTHLVWDAFTHDGARGVRMFPALDEPIFEFGRRHVAGVRLMQDVGSLIGLAVVLLLVWRGLRRGRDAAVPNRPVAPAERHLWMWLYVGAAALFSLAFYLWARALGEAPTHLIIVYIYDVAVAALRGLAAALLGVSLALDLRLRSLRYRNGGH
jgi:Domain of unknown function (DUF4184)